MANLVTGLFEEAEDVPRAIEALVHAHFEVGEISVVVADVDGEHEVPISYQPEVGRRATGGGAIGAALGAIGATLVSTGVVVTGGVALAVAGPIALALESAVVGMVAGGAIGALSGLESWKTEVDLHAEDLREGAVMVAVHAEGARVTEARSVLEGSGATRVIVPA